MGRSPRQDRRPSWDDYFLHIATVVAQRSTCLRRKVGAALVLDKRILATGYNGAPSGLPHCAEVGCLRDRRGVPSGERHELCRGLHAEENALLQAARYGIRIEGSTIYTTHVPCSMCTKMIINCGIRRVVATRDYPDGLGRELLGEAGIELCLKPSWKPWAGAEAAE
jgi:dCMP deaminase